MESGSLSSPLTLLGPSVAAGMLSFVCGGGGLSVYALTGSYIGALVAIGLCAVGVGVGVYFRWSRPLTFVIASFSQGEDHQAFGPGLIRVLYYRLQAERQRQEVMRRETDEKWQRGITDLVNDRSLEGQSSEMRVLLEDLLLARDEHRRLFAEDINRLVRSHEAAREVSFELKRRIKKEEETWGVVLEAARRAETGLASIGPELVERCSRERERLDAFLSATDRFRSGVERLASQSDSLAAQASRATDRAAQEVAREARLARGEQGPPLEPPPLRTWAANLDTTARELRRLVAELRHAPKLTPAEWIGLNREALDALVACGQSTAAVVTAHDSLLRAVSAWFEAHEEDLRPLWGRLKKSGTRDPWSLEASGPSMASLIAELEGAAERANARIEVAALRAAQLLRSTT